MASSITTAEDRKSHRPAKRRALTPVSQQLSHVEALFANPNREIHLPSSNSSTAVTRPAPPEIVTNVQGSSAGAGSGEFHVYKASRRREYERLRMMDEEMEKEKADEEYEKKKEEIRRKEEETLSKNRAKREKAKMRKQKKGKEDTKEQSEESVVKKKGLGPAKVVQRDEEDGAEEIVLPETDGQETAEPTGITIHDDD